MAALAAAGWYGLRPIIPPGPVGLFSSLPIVLSDNPDPMHEFRGDRSPIWALGVIGDFGSDTVVALDTIDPVKLRGLKKVMIAQSRALSPQENVALDAWVRGGGRVLLLVDPLLTEPSRFALGDPRRPQSTAMLSPILAHWGLELLFDETQAEGEREVRALGTSIPVDMAGHFKLLPPSGCRLIAGGLLASCTVGKGRVLALADAQVLARGSATTTNRRALRTLLQEAFADR